ncbi:MAG: hypothetical protein QOJ50_1147, partial [Cryptosporangiaceae bacterium]|nr:hypothetical protein [Cryptosporangiaceae bacterium]
MTLTIADITSYLASTGWVRGPETWNGAPIWLRSGDFAVLVPPRDGLGYGTARVREILRCLSAAEQRSEEQIADEIAAPLADVQEYRAFPSGHAAGYIPLAAGTAMIQGIERLIRASARVVADGPHVRFTGQPPPGVRRVLRAAELGPARPGSFVLSVRMPVAGAGEPSGRRVLTQLAEATGAARTALDSGSVQAFDHTVTSGV